MHIQSKITMRKNLIFQPWGPKVAIFGRDDLHPLYFYAPPLVPTTGLKLPQQKLKVQEDLKVVLILPRPPLSPKKNFKIGPLGDFEKSAFLYFHPSQYNLAPGIKGATDQMLP